MRSVTRQERPCCSNPGILSAGKTIRLWQDSSVYRKLPRGRSDLSGCQLAASVRIFEIQGCEESVVISWDGVIMFSQAGNVTGNGIPRHFTSFFQSASVSDAARQRWNQGRVPALRLRTQHDVVAIRGLAISAHHYNRRSLSSSMPGHYNNQFPLRRSVPCGFVRSRLATHNSGLTMHRWSELFIPKIGRAHV